MKKLRKKISKLFPNSFGELKRDYKNFCILMHNECNRERRAYNEPEISYNDYVKNTKSLLHREYVRQNSDKGRKVMDAVRIRIGLYCM